MSKPETVAVSDFRADLSEMIAACKDRPVIVERYGEAQAVLISMADFIEKYQRSTVLYNTK